MHKTKLLTGKLYLRFHYFKHFISTDSCEAQKLTKLEKLSALIQPRLFQVLSSLCTYLWDINNSQSISEKYFHEVGKKCLYQMLLSFSKMKLIYICIFLLYCNSFIYVYWGLGYHYYVSNSLRRVKTMKNIWWCKLLFLNCVFEQNIIR